MSKQFNNFLLKVFILSTFIVLAFNIWNNLINATETQEKNLEVSSNSSTFQKVNNNSLWKTWVAIATNIWIKYKQREQTPATIYKDIFSINEIINNQDTINEELIWSNMLHIDEYKNILKTDVKQLLDSSYDKSRFLNAFIEQLEFRYVLWVKNFKKLSQQKSIFENDITSVNAKIALLKQKIEKDFKENNAKESLLNIDEYLKLKEKYNYSRTYIIYINHFLNEYNYLNSYNKLLIDTLINNKEALIKDAFVVIPDSWWELLKKFNLIYSEDEFKK